ncbi:MAG: amino acid adenylation domain-containing protein [Alteromonadaceae bacterium]|jgi:amino acid adenylation domain-containing protein
MKFHLSPIQQGMYVSSLSYPNEGIDIEQIIIEFDEEVDVLTLQKCWQNGVDNFDILRAAIIQDDESIPVHSIQKSVELKISSHDWSSKDKNGLNEALELFLIEDRARGFDLSCPPLMRLNLIKITNNHSYLIWTFHHIILDGRSFNLVLNEVFDQYDQIENIKTHKAPSFREYIKWVDDLSLDNFDSFWRNYLQGFTVKSKLPTCSYEVKSKAIRYGEVEAFLNKNLTSQLQAFSLTNNVTMNTLLQGAWSILLHRHSGESDIVFANTKTTRSASIPGASNAVGIFLATLPLRVNFFGKTRIKDVLKGLREDWVAIRPYEQSSIADIAKWSDVDKSQGIFDSLVLFESYQFEQVLKESSSSWNNRQISLRECTNFTLALLGYGGEELRLKLEFDSRKYGIDFSLRLLKQVENILQAFVSDVTYVDDIDLLTEEENSQLAQWNHTEEKYDNTVSVYHLFYQQQQNNPAAISFRSSAECLSYCELNQKVEHLATYLQIHGIDNNCRVGINMNRDSAMIVALLAVWKIGATYIPLDPAFPADRLLYMVEDSTLSIILRSDKEDNIFIGSDITIIDVNEALTSTINQPYIENTYDPKSVAYILYTSGSTGKPKGVQISNIAFSNFICSMRKKPGITAQDKLLAITTLSFDIAGLEIFLPLIAGAELILANKEQAADGRKLLQMINEFNPTVMQATPATWRMLIDTGLRDQKNLKVLCGGEALSLDLAHALNEQVGQLWNMYGPTETCVWSTVNLISSNTGKITIGKAIGNTELFLVDEHMSEVPIGSVGELLIGGDGVAVGYLNRPELNKDVFVYHNNKKVYKTGDLAKFSEYGDLECLGRKDNQVKIRGFRIELGEIEEVLVKHVSVALSAVIVDDNNVDKRLIAFVELNSAQNHQEIVDQLLQLAKNNLPYYMVPALILVKDTLPLTPNNKVDRKALAKDKIDIQAITVSSIFVEPDTIDEILMHQLWQHVLKLDKISIHDNFFDIGGDSLSAVMLLVNIEEAFKVNLPLPSLIENNSIARLAVHVRTFVHKAQPVITELKKGSELSSNIFCIPGAAGNAMALYNFAQEFDEGYNIIGLELNANGKDIVAVTSLARMLHSVIKEQQPVGPYKLIGLCFGSLITIELARLFEQASDEIELLVLLDPPKLKFNKSLSFYYKILSSQLARIGREGPMPIARAVYQKIAKKYIKSECIESEPANTNQIIANYDRLRDLRISESLKYIPSTYSNKAILCYVETGGVLDLLMCKESWNSIISKKNREIHHVEGSHGDFFLKPYSHNLAKIIKAKCN